MLLRNFFRKRRLRRDASTLGTGLIPLRDITNITVLMDAGAEDFTECREAITAYCAGCGIEVNFTYSDFRKFNGGDKPGGENRDTVFRSCLNWYGKPYARKTPAVLILPCDLFICLTGSDRYCIEYISVSVKSRFKIGRIPFSSCPYDIVVSSPSRERDGAGSGAEQLETFKTITAFLEKID